MYLDKLNESGKLVDLISTKYIKYEIGRKSTTDTVVKLHIPEIIRTGEIAVEVAMEIAEAVKKLDNILRKHLDGVVLELPHSQEIKKLLK